MTTALERYEDNNHAPALPDDPTGGRLVAWASGLKAAHQIGSALCKTAFAPKHFQNKPEEAAAAILYGDEIGFTPTQSLRSIYVVSGTPALYARAMVSLVLSHGHEIWTEEDLPGKVTVAGRRKGSSRVETVTWTTERARKAGYTNNKKYESDSQAMLYARASGDVARRIAPDVLAGIAYTVEEMELGDTPTVTVKRGSTSRTRTAKRAEIAPAPEPDEPNLDEPAPANVATETGELVDADPITKPQLTKLQICLKEYGITDRDAGLAYYEDVIGREVSSSKELTKDEAIRIIDQLEREIADAKTVVAEPELDPTEGEGWGT